MASPADAECSGSPRHARHNVLRPDADQYHRQQSAHFFSQLCARFFPTAAVAAGGRAVGLVAERARLGRVGGGAQRNERLGRARAQLGLLDAVGVREVGARVSGAAASSFAALSCSAPEGRHNVLYW